MEQITREMSATMDELRRAGKQTVDVGKIIDGITFQARLLALNAALEAAQGGNERKGVATIQQEVSATPAKVHDIDCLVGAIAQIGRLTRHAAASAEQSATVSRTLEEVAMKLRRASERSQELLDQPGVSC